MSEFRNIICPVAFSDLSQRAAEDETDLVVMGVHGGSAAEIMLFGSTTHHVVREATCPVLAIRAR